MTAHESISQVREQLRAAIIGQEAVIDRLLIALLADGHVLMEGFPGTAKTRSIKTLGRLVQSRFSRVQFTPDLLPGDVTGAEIYREGDHSFEFQPGPVFGNLVLADEINRAPAKVQAALLEAMEERQVTVSGRTHPLPQLFMVLATQNPIEQEGTYPLPEAQMDRFLLYVRVDYPSPEHEVGILRLVRRERAGGESGAMQPVPQEAVFAARAEVAEVHVSAAVERYMVDLVIATREPQRHGGDLARWIRVGGSPRATLALDAAARAHAWLNGADYVTPEDVRAVAPACLAHRIHLSYEAEAAGVSRETVINAVLAQVSPV